MMIMKQIESQIICCQFLSIMSVCWQLFRLNAQGQIAYGEQCIEPRGGNTIHVIYCPVSPSGPWLDFENNSAFRSSA